MQKLTATESPSVPTVVVSVEKAYQQLYCKNVSMVYFMKDWSKELPIPFRLAARKLYLLQRSICFFFYFDDPFLFEQFTKYPLWLVENHVAPGAAHITRASISIVLIIQKVIATV